MEEESKVQETENSATKVEKVPDEAASLIGAYLKEVRKVALLKPEEELELARRIAKGDEEARSRMIRSNLRLVVKIAKAYVNRGVPFLDLIEEGNIGLMKGVERFKAEKGFRFSTYGSWWIRQAIERAIYKQGRTIRVPVHVLEDIDRLKRVGRKLEIETGKEATDADLIEHTGFKPEYVERLTNLRQSIVSMEKTLDVDGDITLQETLPNPDAEDPVQMIFEQQRGVALEQALSQLTERESGILRLRFGMDDDNPRTLRQIGEQYGVTRERVRQIEREALGKVRGYMVQAAQGERRVA